MSSAASKGKSLPQNAAAELPNVAAWLQGSEANFQPVDNVEVCKNTDALATAAANFLIHFASEVTFNPTQNRITAIHCDAAAVVPVDQGWVVNLIPVHVAKGVAMVDNQQLNIGHYSCLTRETRVSGDFVAVLLLSRLN